MRGFKPMTLANMRLNGVRMVTASCANCGRSADVNVDLLPETLTVPETGQRLRCSQLRRQDDLDPPRLAYSDPKLWQPQLSARTAAVVLGDRRRPARRPARRAGSAFAQGPATATEPTHAKRRCFTAL